MPHSFAKSIYYPILTLVAVVSAIFLAAQVYNQRSITGESKMKFDAGELDLVAMTISDTMHYSMTEEGSDEFSRLMPTGGHIVHVSSANDEVPKTFTVALFHQLKCLEIYHREYLKPTPRKVTKELRGCLNYLRQSVLCHANTRLESIKNTQLQVTKQYETVCRDWTKVYRAAEDNYNQYQAWLNETSEGHDIL